MDVRATDNRQHATALGQPLQHDVDWMIAVCVYELMVDDRPDGAIGRSGISRLLKLFE